ncbi:uncharacterized protein LOC131206984 [Anopheles bellator]|uniref:uncharacterized protein LOC131206984 n=1 Tax=Anopheles bellator TaxID=139047 RepID=UPI0026478E32|nr:uncharacterized protein LOC131206984 [Anopheles bellator]
MASKVLIFDVENKEELYSVVVSELRRHNIKYRKEKTSKASQDKVKCRRIFNAPLHTLELTDVILANGGIVQIPLFVSNACQFILENVDTEGLFRKAGSSKRQRDIRTSLESGKPLGRSYHVIDVANLLKTFFRDLPEPLLPCGNVQEALLRCLLGEQNVQKLLMTCLLLPPLTLNTLAFFMQFLHTVSQHSGSNKMTVNNLSIIITPNLMPFVEDQKRMASNQQVVQLLIEHSQQIGLVPDTILRQLKDENVNNGTINASVNDRKKKKRRSGSLTRMFNGFRKIVGAIGSSENLDKTDELEEQDPTLSAVLSTPCLSKSAKKRKVTDGMPFSVKKKKEVTSFLPDNQELLPCTPTVVIKEVKKSRLSLGGGKKPVKIVQRLLPSGSVPSIAENKPMERRWSVVGAPWGRKKQSRNKNTAKDTTDPSGAKTEDEFESEEVDKTTLLHGVGRMSPVMSMPCLTSAEGLFDIGASSRARNQVPAAPDETDGGEEDFLNFQRSEYEAIKKRMTVIETTISQEFRNLGQREEVLLENVENKYRQTLEHTEPIEADCSSTDQLAKRLSRELKIRQSGEHKMIRSPSARKIGTIRRRSREAVRLSRNQSWHIGSGSTRDGAAVDLSFYPKPAVLKRGRPNTVQSGLKAPDESEASPENFPKHSGQKPAVTVEPSPSVNMTGTNFTDEEKEERWVNAESYFETHNVTIDSASMTTVDSMGEFLTPAKVLQEDCFQTPDKHPRTSSLRSASKNQPSFVTKIEVNNVTSTKTPMLPPPTVPPRSGKTPAHRTPRLPPRTPSSGAAAGLASIMLKSHITPLQQEAQSGRASIARIRSQNAGMVMAKAKLFDGLVTNADSGPLCSKRTVPVNGANRRQSAKFRSATVAIPLEATPDRAESHPQLRQIQKLRSSSAHGGNQRSPRRGSLRKRAFKSGHHNGVTNRREKLRQISKGQASVGSGISSKVLNSPCLMRQLQENVQEHFWTSDNGSHVDDCLSPNVTLGKAGGSASTTPHIRHRLLRNSPRRILAATPYHENRMLHHAGDRTRTPMKAIRCSPSAGSVPFSTVPSRASTGPLRRM